MQNVNNRVVNSLVQSHFENVSIQEQIKPGESHFENVQELCQPTGDHSQFETVNPQQQLNKSESPLILSLFSGVDLLGGGFLKNGFCVVSAGDIILGKDVRNVHPPPNKFAGIIGGPPCQDFSKLRRIPPTGYGLLMLAEFKRIVIESACDWFLMENVPCVPDIQIDGYHVQRFSLCPTDLGFKQSRNRHFQFGSKSGLVLVIERQPKPKVNREPCLTAWEGTQQKKRTFLEFCQLQGLSSEMVLPDLTQSAKYKVIGNGVHLGVADYVAKSIRESTYSPDRYHHSVINLCPCGCGERLTGRLKMKTASCRKRMKIKRDSAAVNQRRS